MVVEEVEEGPGQVRESIRAPAWEHWPSPDWVMEVKVSKKKSVG